MSSENDVGTNSSPTMNARANTTAPSPQSKPFGRAMRSPRRFKSANGVAAQLTRAESSHDANFPENYADALRMPDETSDKNREEHIARRRRYQGRPKAFSAETVANTALGRYFELIAHYLSTLRGRFTSDELRLLLDIYASPLAEWHVGCSMATALVDHHGEGDFDETTDVGRLALKLSKLDPGQDCALADACERMWRAMADETESYTALAMKCGLVIDTSADS